MMNIFKRLKQSNLYTISKLTIFSPMLLIYVFIGFTISVTSFAFSKIGVQYFSITEETLRQLSFFTVFGLTMMGWTTLIRDGVVTSKRLMLFIQLPLSFTKKKWWLLGSYHLLPTFLVIMGSLTYEGDFLINHLDKLLVYVFISTLLFFLHYQGGFHTFDTDTLFGGVATRNIPGIGFLQLLIALSPIAWVFLSQQALLILLVLLALVTIIYYRNGFLRTEYKGGDPRTKKKVNRLVGESWLKRNKKPTVNYFLFLHVEELNRPYQTFIVQLILNLFILLTYYITAGFLFNDTVFFEQMHFIAAISIYSCFFLRVSSMITPTAAMSFLLPLSDQKKILAEAIDKLLLPSIYGLVNLGIVSAIIYSLHNLPLRFIVPFHGSYWSMIEVLYANYIGYLILSYGYIQLTLLINEGLIVLKQRFFVKLKEMWVTLISFIIALQYLIIILIDKAQILSALMVDYYGEIVSYTLLSIVVSIVIRIKLRKRLQVMPS